MGQVIVELRSQLDAPVSAVWDHASTMAGVNHELAPWVRMTVPRSVRGRRLGELGVGALGPARPVFVSTLLLLSLVPFDRHHLTLERVWAHGFCEESWSWLQRRWRHERWLEPEGAGCTVTDKVVVEPRLAPTWLVARVVRALFRSRHRRLRRRFGGSDRPRGA